MFLSRPHLLYTRIMAFLQLGFGGIFGAISVIGLISCPNCGASNSFKVGFISKCRFCDTHIQV